MSPKKKNLIAEKSYQFAIKTIRLYKYLVERKEFTLSKQLLRCGTSIGANVEEAIGGISKRDFRAKMAISYKEARETDYWLRLLKDTHYITEEQYNNVIDELSSILKILYRIIESSKE